VTLFATARIKIERVKCAGNFSTVRENRAAAEILKLF